MFCYFVSVKLMSSRLTNVFSVFCALSISGTMLKNMAHFSKLLPGFFWMISGRSKVILNDYPHVVRLYVLDLKSVL